MLQRTKIPVISCETQDLLVCLTICLSKMMAEREVAKEAETRRAEWHSKR